MPPPLSPLHRRASLHIFGFRRRQGRGCLPTSTGITLRRTRRELQPGVEDALDDRADRSGSAEHLAVFVRDPQRQRRDERRAVAGEGKGVVRLALRRQPGGVACRLPDVEVRDILDRTPGVVDVDSYIEDEQTKYRFVVDKEKAALNGVSAGQVATTLSVAVEGANVGLAHQHLEKEDVPIILRLPLADRSSVDALKRLKVSGQKGNMVALGELVNVQLETNEEHLSQEPDAGGLRDWRRGWSRGKSSLCDSQT